MAKATATPKNYSHSKKTNVNAENNSSMKPSAAG
jgi:hypothetical protein